MDNEGARRAGWWAQGLPGDRRLSGVRYHLIGADRGVLLKEIGSLEENSNLPLCLKLRDLMQRVSSEIRSKSFFFFFPECRGKNYLFISPWREKTELGHSGGLCWSSKGLSGCLLGCSRHYTEAHLIFCYCVSSCAFFSSKSNHDFRSSTPLSN